MNVCVLTCAHLRVLCVCLCIVCVLCMCVFLCVYVCASACVVCIHACMRVCLRMHMLVNICVFMNALAFVSIIKCLLSEHVVYFKLFFTVNLHCLLCNMCEK